MDEDEDVYRIAVYKIQRIRINSHYQCQIIKHQDNEASSSQSNNSFRIALQKFTLSKLNVKAKAYHQLINLDSIDFKQPPAARHRDDAIIEQCRHQPLFLNHPCHNQRVERHVKLVTEVSASVSGHDNRDSMIH